MKESINQSINQSISQPINQTVNRLFSHNVFELKSSYKYVREKVSKIKKGSKLFKTLKT